MDIEEKDLSEAEIVALKWIRKGVGTFVHNIDAKTTKDVFGDPIPGMGVFKKLEKKGLCFQTEEDALFLNEGDTEAFQFSSTMELTDEGLELARKLG